MSAHDVFLVQSPLFLELDSLLFQPIQPPRHPRPVRSDFVIWNQRAILIPGSAQEIDGIRLTLPLRSEIDAKVGSAVRFRIVDNQTSGPVSAGVTSGVTPGGEYPHQALFEQFVLAVLPGPVHVR